MGCHKEPPIVHNVPVLQKLHFFQFFNFFNTLQHLPQKKITRFYRKKVDFLYILHDLSQKKKHDLIIVCTRAIFFTNNGRIHPV